MKIRKRLFIIVLESSNGLRKPLLNNTMTRTNNHQMLLSHPISRRQLHCWCRWRPTPLNFALGCSWHPLGYGLKTCNLEQSCQNVCLILSRKWNGWKDPPNLREDCWGSDKKTHFFVEQCWMSMCQWKGFFKKNHYLLWWWWSKKNVESCSKKRKEKKYFSKKQVWWC